MIRLTFVAESRTSIAVKVEGRVVSDACSVLEAECLRHLARGYTIVLDLAGVTFIDARGAALLRGLKARNVDVINCWPLIEEQITA